MSAGTAGVGRTVTADALGDDLYRIVCDYGALGHHRSGTDRDGVWDERSTLHRSAADHFPQHRIIRRLEIDGDRPYFDPTVS